MENQQGAFVFFIQNEHQGKWCQVHLKKTQDWRAISFVKPAVHVTPEVLRAAVSGSWRALEVAAPVDDGDIVLLGVAQSAEALRFASVGLRDDYAFIEKAIQVDGRALHYASSRLQGDRLLVLEASKLNSWAIDCAPETLRMDPCFLEEVLAVNPAAKRFLREEKTREVEDVAAEIDEPRVHHSICPLMGRWRYVDDGSEEDDFVLEFLEDATGQLAVCFLLCGAVTAATCSAVIRAENVLRIEEQEGQTRNVYEALLPEAKGARVETIHGRFWCEASDVGNSFEAGSVGNFSLHRLEDKSWSKGWELCEFCC
eukprot:symbB.v1.2.016733.t1/scaffold1281.1/size129568/1